MAQKDCALKYQQWVVRCCVQMRSKFKWAAVLLFTACRPLEIDTHISVWAPCAICDSPHFFQRRPFSCVPKPATKVVLLFKINSPMWLHSKKIGHNLATLHYIRAKNAQFRQYEFSTICHCRFKSHADPLMDTHHNPLSELLRPGHHCPLQHRVATLTAPH